MSFADFFASSGLTDRTEKRVQPNRKKYGRRAPASKGKTVTLMADFEATTEVAYNIEGKSRVWSWGYVSLEEPEHYNVIVGLDINSYIESISQFNSTTYFHNMRYDMQYVIPWLFENGYKHVEFEDEFVDGTFMSSINNMNVWYTITVKWKTGYRTEFRDSHKKIPLSVKRMAKAYHLDESKGDIDYDADRPVGYQPTEEEWDYLRRDILIVAKALKQVISEGMTGLTVGGDALREYKALITKEEFDRRFPVLDKQIDDDVRHAYRGGFTYADPRFKQKWIKEGKVYDVNSLYPSVMKDYILPYGHPQWIEDEEDIERLRRDGFELFITTMMITAVLKPNHIPTLQLKRFAGFIETEYVTRIDEPTEVTLTSVDWKLLFEHYDVEVDWFQGGWAFRAKAGLFDEYIDKWGKIKMESVGGLREIAKLFMNSLYGKFATNPHIRNRIPVLEDGLIRLRASSREQDIDPVYTPMGCFITAYARSITIRAAQENYGRFLYADTDSLHLLGLKTPKNIRIHKTNLGSWKHEYDFKEAIYIRAKAYSERIADENIHEEDCDENCPIRHDYVNRFAGLSNIISETLTFDDIYDGNVIHGSLKQKVVNGGVILVDSPYKINFT